MEIKLPPNKARCRATPVEHHGSIRAPSARRA
jgi:hypothetical protein